MTHPPQLRRVLRRLRAGGRDVSVGDLQRAIFGDRLGTIVFLAALAVYLSYWRIGMVITDTYTVANTLVAVSEGHLHVERAVYGPGLDTPGMGTRDGLAYGRNYGQVFLALPFLWLLEAVAAVADLRVALAALWAGLLLGVSRLVGAELERSTAGTYVGCALALLVFASVVTGATSIDASQHYLMALQLQTMVAAALVGVVCYRFFTWAYGRRVGLGGGLAASLATPIGFWAQFPKRHVLVALCVVTTMALLYRSREGDGVDTQYRAAAYVPVGIAAWVSAAEGIVLLLALLAIDVPTGGRSIRSLSTAGVTCVLAVTPMFVTNLFVTGNPAEPPRALTYGGGGGSLAERGSEATGGNGGGGDTASGSGTGSGSGSGSTGSSGAGDDSGLLGSLDQLVDTLVGGFDLAFELVGRGFDTATMDVGQLYPVFVRGGYISTVASRDAGEAIRLSFLEAMPLAAVLIAVPVVVARSDVRARLTALGDRQCLSALGTVDAFAVVYALGLTLVYLPRLPLHATITVRYLLPLFPIALYGLLRLPAVRRVIDEQSVTCALTYLGGVCIGGQLLVVYLWSIDAARGEAMQAHALVGLAVAALVAGWAVVDASGSRNDRLGAIALGLAAAAGTVFLLLAALWHFAFVGGLAFPIF
ncbi:hypothetical protein HWV07_17855 [Natronomonas salina]|uniref:hypothetical protein n=1 Tax=Natronomonas salina TaxID=1710540 RepID=UPI0015B3A2A0|nr:hypothetical protein [Natronomonas salina]QLD90805.1 hypothetical protein HWV07_17855 [Natronomonas salina]